MTTKEACDYFGGPKKLADLLGVWPQTIYQWGDYPPKGRQHELKTLSHGHLKVEEKEGQ